MCWRAYLTLVTKKGKRLMHYRNCIELNSITNRQLARNVHAYASKVIEGEAVEPEPEPPQAA